MQIALKDSFSVFLKNELKESLQPTNKFWKIANVQQEKVTNFACNSNQVLMDKIWTNSIFAKNILFELKFLTQKVLFCTQMVIKIRTIAEKLDFDQLFNECLHQINYKIENRTYEASKLGALTKYTRQHQQHAFVSR